MKKLLLGCLLLIIAVPLLLVGVAMFALDDHYSVTRAETISAPPAAVHALVGDLETWPEWSAWNSTKDPDAKFTFSDPATGVGAVWTWKSTGPLRNGELTVTRSSVAEGLHYDLVFEDGGTRYESTGSLTFAAEGEGTEVTWTNEGDLNGVVEKLFGLLMDTMMGPDLEAGLQGIEQRLATAEEPVDDDDADDAADDAAAGTGDGTDE